MGSRRRRLGQHFLVDRRVAERIVGLLADAPDRVLEIGPGRGALTEPLLERFSRVLAVEVDPVLAQNLAGRLPDPRLELRLADALREPLDPLLADEAPWQMAANLPYSVGTAILRRLLPSHQTIQRMVVMLQHEVVRRLVAAPGDPGHGLMALERAAHAEARVAFEVPPQAFRPRPRVLSSVVVLDLHPPAHEPHLLDAGLKLAARALTRPRKMLANALRPGPGAETLIDAGLDPCIRPGLVSLADWVRLAELLELRGAATK